MSDHSAYSTLPVHTAAMLYESGKEVMWHLPGDDSPDSVCQGAAYHSPRPLFSKDTRLVLDEWWAKDRERSLNRMSLWQAPVAILCGTCRDNLDILLQMLHHTDGSLDWAVRREFGNAIRALAERGWNWYADQREGAL